MKINGDISQSEIEILILHHGLTSSKLLKAQTKIAKEHVKEENDKRKNHMKNHKIT